MPRLEVVWMTCLSFLISPSALDSVSPAIICSRNASSPHPSFTYVMSWLGDSSHEGQAGGGGAPRNPRGDKPLKLHASRSV